MKTRRYGTRGRLGIVLAMAMLCTSAVAQVYWDNGGGDYLWSTALNWSGDFVPASTSAVQLITVPAANPVTIDAPAQAASLLVGSRIGTINHTVYLDIKADLTVGGNLNLHNKGNGTVTQAVGTVTCGTFYLAGSSSTAGRGTYVLSGNGAVHVNGSFTATGGTGNTFTQAGSGTSVQIDGGVTSGNNGGGDRWTYRISGGTLTIGSSVDRSYGAWFFDQSGGSASIGTSLNLGTGYRTGTAEPMEWSIAGDSSLSIGTGVLMGWVGDGGTHKTGPQGRFTLKGSKGSGSDVTVGGNWRQTGSGTPNTIGSLGTLKAVIDEAAIADPSAMRKVVITGNVTFDSGSVVLPEFDPLVSSPPTSPTTWTLMTWPEGNVADNGLVLEETADPTTWSFAVTPTSLTVTYTPPAPLCTLILLQ